MALLGDERHGSWQLNAKRPDARVSLRYRPATAILETRFETETGAATVIDFRQPPGDDFADEIIRLVHGDIGIIEMATTILLDFNYGRLVPWLLRTTEGIIAVAGPDTVRLYTPSQHR